MIRTRRNDLCRRLKLRPSLEQWRADEPITLAEAVALFLTDGWTCFHCGETFRTPWGARAHFGTPADTRPLWVEAPETSAAVRRRTP
jgi:hypothetical protein